MEEEMDGDDISTSETSENNEGKEAKMRIGRILCDYVK